MKNWPWIFSILVVVSGLILFGLLKVDLRANFTKCEESVIGPEAAAGKCAYPSRLMRVKGVWVCSCRSESETKRGIE